MAVVINMYRLNRKIIMTTTITVRYSLDTGWAYDLIFNTFYETFIIKLQNE
jgi:hypothetical protein